MSSPVPPQPRLLGEKGRKPLYLDHPDLIEQVRALDDADPEKASKYEVIKAEAHKRYQQAQDVLNAVSTKVQETVAEAKKSDE